VIQLTPAGTLTVQVHPLLVEISSVELVAAAVAWMLVGLTL
jgi:hypothetical protein